MTESQPALAAEDRQQVGVPRELSGPPRELSGPPPVGRRLLAAIFGASLLASALLLLLQPIAGGYQYQLGVRVTGLLTLIWYVGAYRAHWLWERWFIGLVVAAGVYVAVQRPLTIRADSEIVAAYRSAFAALDAGRSPYESGSIVHFDERGEHKLGNFNYPPVELVPYYAVSKLVGRWDHWVLTATLVALQLAAWAVLRATFPRAGARLLVAFAPLLVCFELRTNVALTLLGVAVAMYLSLSSAAGQPRREAWLWPWFGVALLTKFFVIPLFAVFALRRLSWRSWRAAVASAAGPCLSIAVAVALMLPFGVADVLRETLLFNLVLSERAKLTTFYPNVLSGMLSWVGVPAAFPYLAVLLLVAAVLWSRRLPLLEALFFAASVFLLVSPTPEPQYIPVMLYLALCDWLRRVEPQGAPLRAADATRDIAR